MDIEGTQKISGRLFHLYKPLQTLQPPYQIYVMCVMFVMWTRKKKFGNLGDLANFFFNKDNIDTFFNT